jgi:NAD(P)H-nitrite reductase large subunit
MAINEQEIKDKLTKTCPCRVISRATIKEAIKNGADTVEKVRQATGATTGSCKGQRCRESIENLILAHKEEEF